MRFIVSLASCAALCIMMAPSASHSSPDWNCIEPALKDELGLKLRFQDDFAEIVSAKRPEFLEVASLVAEASKVNFSMRFSRIVWLWDTHPARFADPNDFWVLSWSDEDASNWRAADAGNAAAEKRLEELQATLSELPILTEFQAYVSEKRATSPYLELYVEFGDDIRNARTRVAECY